MPNPIGCNNIKFARIVHAVLNRAFNVFIQDTLSFHRPSDGKEGLCTASVDSILELGNCEISVLSKGNFLYSAATAQSAMDYSSSKIEEGVVDSPPSHVAIPEQVYSPSPKRMSAMRSSSNDKYRDNNGSQRSLYGKDVEKSSIQIPPIQPVRI